jgi:hypothetical protein
VRRKNLYEASALFTPDEKLDFQNLTGRRIAVALVIMSLRLKNAFSVGRRKGQVFL